MNEEMVAAIKDFLIDRIDPDFIMLFGSQVTGNVHPNSDVDLAFYRENHGLSAYDIFILAGELSEITKISVDLIDLNEASTVFKAQIFSTGIPIYTLNQVRLDHFRMNAMSMYANLDVERREILKSIVESGTIYGS